MYAVEFCHAHRDLIVRDSDVGLHIVYDAPVASNYDKVPRASFQPSTLRIPIKVQTYPTQAHSAKKFEFTAHIHSTTSSCVSSYCNSTIPVFYIIMTLHLSTWGISSAGVVVELYFQQKSKISSDKTKWAGPQPGLSSSISSVH